MIWWESELNLLGKFHVDCQVLYWNPLRCHTVESCHFRRTAVPTMSVFWSVRPALGCCADHFQCPSDKRRCCCPCIRHGAGEPETSFILWIWVHLGAYIHPVFTHCPGSMLIFCKCVSEVPQETRRCVNRNWFVRLPVWSIFELFLLDFKLVLLRHSAWDPKLEHPLSIQGLRRVDLTLSISNVKEFWMSRHSVRKSLGGPYKNKISIVKSWKTYVVSSYYFLLLFDPFLVFPKDP